nr:MAG TPA: hypothetical protein [Caudoviricetes sp.]
MCLNCVPIMFKLFIHAILTALVIIKGTINPLCGI